MQVPWEVELMPAVQQGLAAVDGKGLTLVLNVCLRPSDPAKSNFDETAIAKRIDAARNIAAADDRILIQIDTFEDVDRGYGPRLGLIDRLSNLRGS